jgi:hypothetical protein
MRWPGRCSPTLAPPEAVVDEPEPGWGLGDQILFELPDGQTGRCRIVNVLDDGTVQVVPEHQVSVG